MYSRGPRHQGSFKCFPVFSHFSATKLWLPGVWSLSYQSLKKPPILTPPPPPPTHTHTHTHKHTHSDIMTYPTHSFLLCGTYPVWFKMQAQWIMIHCRCLQHAITESTITGIDQSHKSQRTSPISHNTPLRTETWPAHFCSEWCTVGALWDLWDNSTGMIKTAPDWKTIIFSVHN